LHIKIFFKIQPLYMWNCFENFQKTKFKKLARITDTKTADVSMKN